MPVIYGRLRTKHEPLEIQREGVADDGGTGLSGLRCPDVRCGVGALVLRRPRGGKPFRVDPLPLLQYNPLLLVDKDGKWDTHYIDQYNNVILQTDDGSDDVVRVPAERMSEFLSVLKASRWDPARLNSRGWNDYWKGEFGLADIQFSAEELFALACSTANGRVMLLRPIC